MINKVVRIQLNYLYDWDQYRHPYDALFEIQQQVVEAKNKTIQILWEWGNFAIDFKKQSGVSPNPREYANGYTLAGYIYNKLKEDGIYKLNTGNLSQVIRSVNQDFKNADKEMRRGERSVISYKKNAPIEIHNENIRLKSIKQKYYVSLGMFSREYAKEREYADTQMVFELYRLQHSQMEIVERCICGTYKVGASKLIYNEKKRCWFLNLTYQFEPPKLEQLDPDKIMGVDLGIACVACMGFTFSPDRAFIEGGEVESFRRKTEARKKSLQRQGKFCGDGRIGHGYETRNQPLLKLGDSVARFRDTANHKYSRFIVDQAVKHGCGTIQMEELHMSHDDKFLKDWTYFDLRTKIEYKAKEKGIQVVFVSPRYTSQRCSRCGHIDAANRPKKEKGQAYFKCVRCGFEENADYNASLNLATAGIDRIISETLRAKRKQP